MNPIASYTRWLHTQWPAGTVEPLPVVKPDGSTNVPGVYVVGDLAGVPLLKFAVESGSNVARLIARQLGAEPQPAGGLASRATGTAGVVDIAIIGAGVAGLSAAVEARKLGLSVTVVEASEPFSTIVNFPKAKPIFTYPTSMQNTGGLTITANVKEALLDELRAQLASAGVTPVIGRVSHVTGEVGQLSLVMEEASETRSAHTHTASVIAPTIIARRVIIATGRSGEFRMLDVLGENLPKVFNRLHDPKDYTGQSVLVVGGGDSAVETAVALAEAGARVRLSYRRAEFSRVKPDNLARLHKLQIGDDPDAVMTASSSGRVTMMLHTQVVSISPDSVVLKHNTGQEETVHNDVVFTMLGREPSLDLIRKSNVKVRADWRASTWIGLVLVLACALFIYHWKKSWVTITGIPAVDGWLDLGKWWADKGWFPYNVPHWWASLGSWFDNPATILGTMKVTVGDPGFYYSLLYCGCVVGFGVGRIMRRRTKYVTLQTVVLALIQVVPLFLLPYILLPWLGNNGVFDAGLGKTIADALFPLANYGHGREYWRAFGLILAWPLFIWNVFTEQPMWTWLIISLVQTFMIIPVIVYIWGKGAYCSWVCSCGALAETLGDTQREKMPHGKFWNYANMTGQVFLVMAFLILILRVGGWVWPTGPLATGYSFLLQKMPVFNYVWFVDVMWAGVLGVGLYWHFSGRVWCRFACPLAALMNIYTRFSRFRIFADKKKCISCNVCTSVCHMGIDVMAFANKGEPMNDPQCVRCSACVSSCPTGVLSFGQIDTKTGEILKLDKTPASRVQTVELTISAKRSDF